MDAHGERPGAAQEGAATPQPETLLVDTHLHLDDRRFEDDREAVLARAWRAGVRAVLSCGSDLASSAGNLDLADRFNARARAGGPDGDGALPAARVWVAVGIHPHEAARSGDLEAAMRTLEALASHPAVVAIGEIGLDFHYDFSPRPVQHEVFERQLALARRLGKPVVIHAREAEDAVLAALQRYDGVRGVLHAFAGSVEQARRALDLGCYLGVGGMLTFRNAENVRAVARWAPLDRLLLETDAPYLAPVPHRGRRNEPAYVALVAQKLAELRGLSVSAVAEATTRAARALFSFQP